MPWSNLAGVDPEPRSQTAIDFLFHNLERLARELLELTKQPDNLFLVLFAEFHGHGIVIVVTQRSSGLIAQPNEG